MSTEPSGALHHRIRALLAKAASTEFPDEAEAFAAKAHELMERHAIDEAALGRSHRGGDIVVEDVLVPGPYASARASLLSAVARGAHCRLVLRGPTGGREVRASLVGRTEDLAYVRTMHAALDAQATRAMLAASDPAGRPRSFRHAFLLAYAARIAQRLNAARDAARDAVSAPVRSSVELASVERWSEVDAAVRDLFGPLVSIRRTATSGTGYASGHAAAEHAALGHRPLGARAALPGGR